IRCGNAPCARPAAATRWQLRPGQARASPAVPYGPDRPRHAWSSCSPLQATSDGTGSACRSAGAATLQPGSARPACMDNCNGPSETTQRTLLSTGPLGTSPRSACVVVIHGEGLGARADIGGARVLVGRSQDADL